MRVQTRVEKLLEPAPAASEVDKLTKLIEYNEEKRNKEKEKETVNIDMATRMHMAGLKKLTADLWPRASAVQALATELAKQKKKQVQPPLETHTNK